MKLQHCLWLSGLLSCSVPLMRERGEERITAVQVEEGKVIPADSSMNTNIQGEMLYFRPMEIRETKVSAEMQHEFDAAKSLAESGQESRALLAFADIIRRYPHHSLAQEAQYWIGELHFRRQNYEQARIEFQKVLSYTGKNNTLRAKSGVRIGECWVKLSKPSLAIVEWEAVMRAFPKSEEAKQARILRLGLP